MEDIGMPCSVITSNGSQKSGYVNVEENSDQNSAHFQTNKSKMDCVSTHHEAEWSQSLSETNDNREDFEKHLEASRKRKPSRPFSPNVDEEHGCAKSRKAVKKDYISCTIGEVSPDDYIICENGQPLRCDNCNSPYAIDPTKRKKCIGKKPQKPKFRKRLDTTTNKILTLCNKCGISMGRISKRTPRKPIPTQEDKNSYFAEAEAFASSLAERLNEPDARRLYCPRFRTEPCGCLQKYLKDDEDSSKIDERAIKLIDLLKTAKHLSSEKMHSTQSIAVPGPKTQREESIQCRGIGNRHSKVFEDFVLSNRMSLREEFHLCERASQRVLMYSNNFLHKELKSTKNLRIERKTGKFVKGLLKPILDLPLITCCNDKCVELALTHPKLLESWRLCAQGGQREARRVLAEMLTPCGGSKSNCYKFISLVTVSNHMRKTCGSRDPPEHGLKRWWRENPRKRKMSPSNKRSPRPSGKSEEKASKDGSSKREEVAPDSNVLSIQSPPQPSYSITAAIQLQTEKQELLELQKKLKIQQIQLQQQQQLFDEQVLHQNSHQSVAAASSLQHTIQQLLLSPDIGAVTVLAAPKSLTEPIQVATVEDIAKEGIMIAEAVESTQGMTAENLHQMIRLCQTSSSTNPDMLQNLSGEKELTELSNNSPVLRSESERAVQEMASPAETVPSRQLLRLLEFPLSDPSPHASVITNFADKSHPHTISVVSSSDLEPVTNVAIGVPRQGSCVRSVVILPELMLDPSLIGPKNITQSSDASLF